MPNGLDNKFIVCPFDFCTSLNLISVFISQWDQHVPAFIFLSKMKSRSYFLKPVATCGTRPIILSAETAMPNNNHNNLSALSGSLNWAASCFNLLKDSQLWNWAKNWAVTAAPSIAISTLFPNSMCQSGTRCRFGMHKDRYITSVRVNLHESLALYLSARLLSAHSDKHNPNVVSALEKLASALPESIGQHIARTAEATHKRRPHREYIRSLETFTRAWSERKQVRLTYHNPQTDETTRRVFDPIL